MQQKSSTLFHERLERLRVQRQWTWKQLAEALELSVGFLIMVSRGTRQLSKKAEWRLRQLEGETGITPTREAVAEIGLSDHEEPGEEYDNGLALEEIAQKLYRRNRATYNLMKALMKTALQLETQKQKKKT